MRKENDTRPMLVEDAANYLHCRSPVRGVILARVWVDVIQAMRTGRDQAKTEELAGFLKFLQPRTVAFGYAALGHRHVQNPHLRLAHQPQSHASRNRFVVGMRGKE